MNGARGPGAARRPLDTAEAARSGSARNTHDQSTLNSTGEMYTARIDSINAKLTRASQS